MYAKENFKNINLSTSKPVHYLSIISLATCYVGPLYRLSINTDGKSHAICTFIKSSLKSRRVRLTTRAVLLTPSIMLNYRLLLQMLCREHLVHPY